MAEYIDEKKLTVRCFEPKTILVKEGSVSDELYFIKKGCIRAWYNTEGQELTLQFFFEGESATSLESFLYGVKSKITIETLERCDVVTLKKAAFLELIKTDSDFKNWFYETAIKKLCSHTNRLLSLLKNKPFDRYQNLLYENPKIFQRLPQHYIASYLGITPVSLSRIRNRKKVIS
jgi:CRP-like cAMP-binding protein